MLVWRPWDTPTGCARAPASDSSDEGEGASFARTGRVEASRRGGRVAGFGAEVGCSTGRGHYAFAGSPEGLHLGCKNVARKGSVAAIPFERRAVGLDPNFALAYDGLAVDYANLNQPSVSADYMKKAFELRDRVTERERLHITAHYYDATRELEKASQAYETWRQVYPRDHAPYVDLGVIYMILGQYEKAAAETREALRVEPDNAIAYDNLGQIYVCLNRFDEARATTEEALGRKL